MNERSITPWSAPRWLRLWAGGTLALLFVLLTLGAIVTSFRVGMADPIWPTRPWEMALFSWQEKSPGFLVEHTHRLVGFVLGGAVSILALGSWLTERKPGLRWAGFLALVALLGAFGQLHGTLMKQQGLYKEALERITEPAAAVDLPKPDWLMALSPTLFALCMLAGIAFLALRAGSPGRGVRALGVVLLVAVMAQGMLGGLRVYLNALWGTQLSAIHGVTSQVVVGLAVAVFVGCRSRRVVPADDRLTHESAAARWAAITATLVFAQVIAGSILRHTTSSLGPRLHLLLAFAVVAATIITGRLLADAPRSIRRLKTVLHTLVGLQILFGIEAWLVKFAYGTATAALQPITISDAVIRTTHTVLGYLLFAVAIGLALALRPEKNTIRSERNGFRHSPAELETVA